MSELEQRIEVLEEAVHLEEGSILDRLDALEERLEGLEGRIERVSETLRSEIRYEADQRRNEDYYLERRIDSAKGDISRIESDRRRRS